MPMLLTGGTGRVGSRLIGRLLADGDPTRVLVRDPDSAKRLKDRGLDVVEGDIRDPAVVSRAVDGVDRVVHLAAAFRGVPEEEVVAVNQEAAIRLARNAAAAGVQRFVYVSTGLVYGPGHGHPAREDDALRAPRPYPRTKATAEQALREVDSTSSIGLSILRLGFVYGEGDPHLAESLRWASTAALHQRLHLVHHADVGQAILKALRSEGVAGHAINVADDAPVSVLELYQLNGLVPDDERPTNSNDDPWDGLLDTRKARRVLGVRPIYPSVYTARDAGAL